LCAKRRAYIIINLIRSGLINRKHIIFFVCFVCISQTLIAGELKEFEKDILSSQNDKNENKRRTNNSCNNCSGGSIGGEFFDALFGHIVEDIITGTSRAIVEGAITSNQRISGGNVDNGLDERLPGDLLIPFYKLNMNIQHVSSRIDAFDIKMEVGMGQAGVEGRATKYWDDAANEELEFYQIQYLHRMSFGDKVAINLGIGSGRLSGIDTYRGMVFSMPIIFHNSKSIGLEIRPSFFDADGQTISEWDTSILYTHRKMAFRFGHRSLKSTNVTIDGFYIGFDVIY
jgi:hypothetical protein